jgi:hypothetical protein
MRSDNGREKNSRPVNLNTSFEQFDHSGKVESLPGKPFSDLRTLAALLLLWPAMIPAGNAGISWESHPSKRMEGFRELISENCSERDRHGIPEPAANPCETEGISALAKRLSVPMLSLAC